MTKLTRQQLINDLQASKMRERVLMDENANLRRDHALQSKELIETYRERDDWREAFRLIMKLVK